MSVPVAWVVGLMVALEPAAPWNTTYGKTAEAIARVSESEPLFDQHGEERTAALLVAIAWYESRLKPDARSKDGQFYCLFQVAKRHLPDPDKTLTDPEACARAALKLVKMSLEKCASRAYDERLAMFTSGTCDRGLADSRYRMLSRYEALEGPPGDPRRGRRGGAGAVTERGGAAHGRVTVSCQARSRPHA